MTVIRRQHTATSSKGRRYIRREHRMRVRLFNPKANPEIAAMLDDRRQEADAAEALLQAKMDAAGLKGKAVVSNGMVTTYHYADPENTTQQHIVNEPLTSPSEIVERLKHEDLHHALVQPPSEFEASHALDRLEGYLEGSVKAGLPEKNGLSLRHHRKLLLGDLRT